LNNQSNSEKLAVHDPVPFRIRSLETTVGMTLHRFVHACFPLDPNSPYCNLLQCSHFQSTSVAAINAGDLVGSVTGYRIPDRPDTLFIWQVAVHPEERGKGLARTMLHDLLKRMARQGIRFIETTITPGNEASWKLFTGFAAEQNADLVRSVMFDQESHFEGVHETEYLFRIGPFEIPSGKHTKVQGGN
jgi:L-2,4-diaminobutyric acid acetyltransferase